MPSRTTALKTPVGLGPRGIKLWKAITGGYPIENRPAEMLLLEEACRIADRLEKLDELLRGDVDAWARVRVSETSDEMTLKIDGALSEARQQANQLKQLVAALRLPDEATQKRPQVRGTPRGGYKTSGGAGGTVTALERARAARGGA